jgi:hypothetical protein
MINTENDEPHKEAAKTNTKAAMLVLRRCRDVLRIRDHSRTKDNKEEAPARMSGLRELFRMRENCLTK